MTLQHDYFSRASPETDWLAGLLAADGCVAQNLRRWSFSQSGEDGLELVETVARMIGYQASIHTGRTKGQDSHGISVTSPRMVSDLGSRYLIRPAKTLTYQWPKLEGEQARVFLRGYIDGDGCVGTYPTPQGKPFLHISFVGTPGFMQEALAHIPAAGRTRILKQCKALSESRWSGRHAWQLGQWLYPTSDHLPGSRKSRALLSYAETLIVDPPRWFTTALRRARVLELLGQGLKPMRVAEMTGEDFRFVYGCRSERRKSWHF